VPDSALAIIFDMDSVLLDSEPLHLQALNQVLAPLGYWATAAQNQQFYGLTNEGCWRILVQRYGLLGRLDDYLARYDEAVLRLLERPLTPTPEVTELLARLRRHGMRLALASSSRRSWVDATLRALSLRQAFEVVLSGDDVRCGKPAPDLFLLAARRLGVPAERCVVIEDSPNGVRAGRRAGMTVVAVRRPETADLAFDDADCVVDSLADGRLEQLLGIATATEQGCPVAT
jgi:HAD superfamily hydrolase (TIGR01509 family)